MSKRAALLLNLGSPDSTSVEDVRRYLREFLSDERVIDSPAPIRWFVLNAFILPKRPKNSAAAYQRIWTKDGSPLITTSLKLRQKVAANAGMPVELGMRYGNPSTKDAVARLLEKGVDDIFILPLYPHYAMSSYETAVVEAKKQIEKLAPGTRYSVLPPFYKDPAYIDCLAATAKPYLKQGFDRLLFSFHGIPERHLTKSDPTGCHCMNVKNCCEVPNRAHETCYRHQCFETVKALRAKLDLPEEKVSVSFQSRLGRDPWLKPYTDHVLEELPGQGVKKLLVMCPAFVADNLETLEEINMEGREEFLEAGGKHFDMIPCLNDRDDWVSFLTNRIRDWAGDPLPPA